MDITEMKSDPIKVMLWNFQFNKLGINGYGKVKGDFSMKFVMAIAPLVIVAGIVVYVIQRLKHTYNQGNLGKKKTKGAQDLLNSLIPLGMLFGCAIGIIFGIFFSLSLILTVSLGAGIGYLFGFFAYEIFRK